MPLDEDFSGSGSEEEEKPPEVEELWSELVEACKVGDDDAVTLLLKPAPVEDGKVEVPAVLPEHRDVFEEKVPTPPWPRRWGPLQWAVVNNHDKIVKQLIDGGFGDVYKTPEPNQTNPVHWAAFKGHLHILCDLLHFYKYDPNIVDDCGNTPLHLAAAGAPKTGAKPTFVKCMEILLSSGTNPRLQNKHGNTALQVCTNDQCKQLLRLHLINEKTGVGTDTLLSTSKISSDERALKDICEKVKENMDTSLLDNLMEALEVAGKSFVHPDSIKVGQKLLNVLDAKRELEKAIEEHKGKGTCTQMSDGDVLRSRLRDAVDAGVEEKILTVAQNMVKGLLAEVKVGSVLAQCQKVECADSSHSLLLRKLGNTLNLATKLNANKELLEACKLRQTKMKAEMTIKACLDTPWNPSDAEKDGKHATQVAVMTIEKRLTKLKEAFESGSADGVNADVNLIRQAKGQLGKLEEELSVAQREDSARLQAEAEAAEAAKASKKKKKKK
eukprot:g2272.t1